MKKCLLPLLMLMSVYAGAQSLVLTQSFNEPAVGDQDTYFYIDTSYYSSGLPISTTGSASVWNYTHLQAINPTLTTTYDAPSSVPSASAFTGCSVVQNDVGLFTYLKSTTTPTTQTEILGITSSSLSMTFTNSAIAARYPMTFGNSISDNMAGNFSAFTYSGTCTGSITTTADGTGTLMLPNNVTLTNVLRVKSVQKLSFNVGFLPLAAGQQTIYNYYHASKKFAVLSINYTSYAITASSPTVSSVVTGNSTLFTATNPPTGIQSTTLNETDLGLYPNPFSDALNLELSDALHPEIIRIYSQLGQLVHEQSYSGTINPALQSGLYLVEIKTSQGLIRKKIMKE